MNTVTLQMTPRERVQLWDSLDRVLAGQPITDDARTSLGWIRDRIARQCREEVGDIDLSGDRTATLKAGR